MTRSMLTPFYVYAALIFFTAITVFIARYDPGLPRLASAMIVAAAKALLVLLYFMKLKEEVFLLKLTVIITVSMLLLVGMVTFSDIGYR
jgi:caa(3)-type oxidase subunit IV